MVLFPKFRYFISSCFFLFCIITSQAIAQDTNKGPQAITYSLDADFIDKIDDHQKTNTKLKSDLKKPNKEQALLKIRVKQSNKQLIEFITTKLESVPKDERSKYSKSIKNDQIIVKAFSSLEKSLNYVNTLILEETKTFKKDLPPSEQAIADSKIQLLWQELEVNQSEILNSLQLASQYEIDVTGQHKQFRQELIDQAEILSAALTLTLSEIEALRKSQSIIPNDEDIKSKLNVAENRAVIFSHQLSGIISISNEMEIDTTRYDQQIILATGQINSDIFDIQVILGLLDSMLGALLSSIIEYGPSFFFTLFIFILIIYLSIKSSSLGKKIARTALDSAQVPLSNLLQKMIISMTGNGILFLGILIALSQIGISLGPILAGLGVVGFIIGFALQDSMSNFASGLLILFYRPFDIDDTIEAGGVLGKVKKMSLVNTTIRSFDNQTFVIPNNNIWQSTIKNLTEQKIRRVDLIFGVSYDDDIPKTEDLLQDILSQSEFVLDRPEPIVKVHELGDSSVNFAVRPWVKTEDYWEAYWHITKTVKMRFDEAGISIPYPQRDIHMIQATTNKRETPNTAQKPIKP